MRVPAMSTTPAITRPCATLFAACLLLPLIAQGAQETITRTVEYDYYGASAPPPGAPGQLWKERVDAGGPSCVETVHKYDAYGNRISSVVQPCGSTTAPLTSSWTVNEFDQGTSSADSGNLSYPAGAY